RPPVACAASPSTRGSRRPGPGTSCRRVAKPPPSRSGTVGARKRSRSRLHRHRRRRERAPRSARNRGGRAGSRRAPAKSMSCTNRARMRWQRLKLAAIATATAALAVLGAAPPASAAPHVLVVGDSLEELTSPYLSKYLPGVKLTVNAVGGSNSYQIFDLFQESYDPSQSVIVFDAGTNDDPEYPQILAGNLAKVAAIIGPGTCMVVPTIHGYTVNGVDNTGKNTVVRQFAASRPGTQVPDW